MSSLQHIEWLQKYLELGFSELYVHNVNREQQAFIEVFGDILPTLNASPVSDQKRA